VGISFPIVMDVTGKTAEVYFVRNFPTTFFVDADGVLRGQHLGQLKEDELVDYLKTVGIEP
jgi:cytochrome oxidase Cu insertion factor (SCO1/SenC/PrrC family)